MSPPTATRGLLLGGLAVLSGVVLLARGYPALGVAPALLAGGGWLLALACAPRAAVSVRTVFWLALCLRVPALVQGPVLSDDLNRYVWEGELVLRGFDPYAHAPDDPALAGVRAELAELHGRVNHRDVSAVYPPAAQAVHALAALLGRALPGDAPTNAAGLLRLLYLACDLAVILWIARWCARRGRSPRLALAWGWCPFLAFEFAGSGHLDSLAILLFVAAWVTVEERRGERRSGVLLALAALVKLLPLVALPGWLRERERRARAAGIVVVVLAAGAAPLFLSSSGFAGLSEYGSRWEGFNLGYRGIRAAVERLAGPGAPPEELRLLARRVAGGLWAGCLLVAWFRWKGGVAFARTAIAAFLVLTPVLHPWYLAWILPFLALRLDVEWVWLAAAAPLLYAPLASGRARGDWSEPAWLWPAVAVPFFVLLVARLVRARRTGASTAPAAGPSCQAP